jgi:hypothetical protein
MSPNFSNARADCARLAPLRPAADALQCLPIGLGQKERHEQQEDAGWQRIERHRRRNREAETGDDAHRPSGAQQRPEPGVEGEASVEPSPCQSPKLTAGPAK